MKSFQVRVAPVPQASCRQLPPACDWHGPAPRQGLQLVLGCSPPPTSAWSSSAASPKNQDLTADNPVNGGQVEVLVGSELEGQPICSPGT